MRNIFLLAFVLIIVIGGWWAFQTYGKKSTSPVSNGEAKPLAPEVQAILDKKIELLEELLKNGAIIAEVTKANESNASLTEAKIKELDVSWQASKTITPFTNQFLTNETAKVLIAFQKMHPEFKEIFIADKFGLNVGQTDKTSDYYQADESWWQDSFAHGEGKISNGEIEFDESAQSEAISVYVPVRNAGGAAIGVTKGVIDLSSIKKEL